MKATMEIPDELYRQVKAKSALEGRPIREVAVELFQRYVGGHASGRAGQTEELAEYEPIPSSSEVREAALGARVHEMDVRRVILREIERSLARPSRAELLARLARLDEVELDRPPAEVLRQDRDSH